MVSLSGWLTRVRGTWWSTGSSVVVCALGIAAAAWFFRFLDPVLPVKGWIVWDMLLLWAYTLVLSVACVCAGVSLMTRLFRLPGLVAAQTLSFGAAVGLVVFVLVMYAGGFLRLYGAPFAIAAPLSMIAAGARDTFRFVRAAAEEWSQPAPRPRWLVFVAWGFGAVCVGLLYLGMLTPNALTYDAVWNHLVVAQDYAREGRIFPIRANWVMNLPHLASIVDTWAFLVPGLRDPAQRWMLVLHLELGVVLWTLFHVQILVRWLLRDRPTPFAWVTYFLFPAIFIDAYIAGWSDHYLAFFACPLFLTVIRAAQAREARAWGLAGVFVGATLLCKLQCIYLLIPLGVLVFAIVAKGAWRGRREHAPLSLVRQTLLGPGIAVGAALVVCAPHYLKNWIYFGNPLYPLLQDVFKSRPSYADAAFHVQHLFGDWRYRPPENLVERVKTAVEMTFNFSFVPKYTFMGNRPSFGSVFTLCLPFLPFIRAGRRVWAAAAISVGAVFLWAFTFWVDRHLQGAQPVLVATTAAILALAWGVGWLARVGVCALIFAQLAWSTDFLFIGSDRYVQSMVLIRSSMDGRSAARYQTPLDEHVRLGKSLPKDATLILHNEHLSLGMDRRILLDWIGFQGLIDYRRFRTPRDAYERFRALGVTHVASIPGRHPAASKQEDVIFSALAYRPEIQARHFAGLRVFELPPVPPPKEEAYRVLTLSIPGYADGIYRVDDLSTCEELPPAMQTFRPPRTPATTPEAVRAALDVANAVLIGSAYPLDQPSADFLATKFAQAVGYATFSVRVRR